MSLKEDYIAIGVPAEWIEPLQAHGYITIDKIKALEKPGKLAGDDGIPHKEQPGVRTTEKFAYLSLYLIVID